MCCTSRGSRFGRARRLLLTGAARQVVEAVGAEPRVEPGHAIERFVSPFFYRHLVSGEPIDGKFVDRPIEMWWPDLGLTSGVATGTRGVG